MIEVSGKVQISLTLSLDIEDIARLGPLVTELTQFVEDGGGEVVQISTALPRQLERPKSAQTCRKCGYGYWTKAHKDGCTKGVPVAAATLADGRGGARVCPNCGEGFTSLAHRACRNKVFAETE